MTTSAPAVGYGGLPANAWAQLFGSRDGIVEDYVGDAMKMTLLTSNEASFSTAATVGESYVSINGFTLTVANGERVSLPAPSSGSLTYYIGVLYDPDLNVAIPNPDPTQPPLANPLGPCRLVALTNPGTQVTGGQRFLVVYNVTRTTAALTGAAVLDRRRWVGSTIDFADAAASDASPGNEGNFPRGTVRLGTRRILFRTLNAAGTALAWIDPLTDAPQDLPLASGLITRKNSNANPSYYRFAGNMIGFQGQVQKSNGGSFAGSNTTLGTMPAGKRPGVTRSWLVKAGGSDYAEVRVNTDGTTDGRIILSDPVVNATWFDLSPISYQIGA